MSVSIPVLVVTINLTQFFFYYSDKVTLETVLSFFTGGEEIPPGGYGAMLHPFLNFNNEQPYPTASTCSINLTLPTKYASMSYPAFKSAMDTAMLCHGGFGLV